MPTNLKQKKCKHCGTLFPQFNSVQNWCSPACGYELSETIKRKEFDKETKRRKKAIKPRSQYLKEAQAAFNKFIRLRDADKPCICCSRHYGGQYHAGHYLSVGAHPELRFNEDNCHKQKSSCNSYKSGNQAAYRIRLIKKIGLERVELLEGPQEIQKLTIEEIEAIRKKYNELSKQLEG